MPYPDAVELFTTSLNELLNENKQLAPLLAGPDATGEQVTSYMSGLREAAVGVKRDAYCSQRVLEQQQWYSQKSADNRDKRNIWFALLVVLQVAAGGAAVLLAVHPTFPWKASAVFSTLASATVAWGAMRRYQELAQSYGLAAQELSLIAARAPHIGTEAELARFVNDAETAISREHAMWVARRETK
jgi:membrane protein implicated in regulation of membrane protease activity